MPNLETKNTIERDEAKEFLNSLKFSLKWLKQEVVKRSGAWKSEKVEKSQSQLERSKLSSECRKERSDIFSFITKNWKKENITENDIEFQYKMEFNAGGKHIVMKNKFYKNRWTEIEIIEQINGKQMFHKLKYDKAHVDYATFTSGWTNHKTDVSKITSGSKAEKIALDMFMDKIKKYSK